MPAAGSCPAAVAGSVILSPPFRLSMTANIADMRARSQASRGRLEGLTASRRCRYAQTALRVLTSTDEGGYRLSSNPQVPAREVGGSKEGGRSSGFQVTSSYRHEPRRAHRRVPRRSQAPRRAPPTRRTPSQAPAPPRRKYMRPSSTLKRLALALVLLLAAFGSA